MISPDYPLLFPGYIPQMRFPLRSHPWWADPDPEGYEPPDRSTPWISQKGTPGVSTVTVLGTVRNERVSFLRSWAIWERQRVPDWLSVEYLVLDEGSTDGIREVVLELREHGAPIRYVRTREPGDSSERSCTVVFNAAIRRLVRSLLVVVQWWDRIPGGKDHLRLLVEPHLRAGGIATTAVARHIGGSSSCSSMQSRQLADRLKLVPWKRDPTSLARIAGPLGGHVLPGRTTESAGLCIPLVELLAVGGWDERYQDRASYVNVELWRRLLQSGIVGLSVPEPQGANYHQSHPCPMGREKGEGWLFDGKIRRNQGSDWGMIPFLEVVG